MLFEREGSARKNRSKHVGLLQPQFRFRCPALGGPHRDSADLGLHLHFTARLCEFDCIIEKIQDRVLNPVGIPMHEHNGLHV